MHLWHQQEMSNFVTPTHTLIRKNEREIYYLEIIESASTWQFSRHSTSTPFREDAINGWPLMKVS